MQTKRETSQLGMMLVPSLEEFIPPHHRLRRLHDALDLRLVHEAVRPYYCQDNGRPSIDPEVILRLFVLQAVEGFTSIRELLQTAAMHLGYRWFIGYELHEPLPDHSTLSKALARFPDAVFDELFQQSIAQCRQRGLIEGQLLHVDATTIRADLDKDRAKQPNPPDWDARYGRFPGNRKEPGYKQHTVADDQSGVILAVAVTPANVNEGNELLGVLDQATATLGQRPVAVCADAAYASGENAEACAERGIQLVSPPHRPRNGHSAGHFTIEQFIYDEGRDEFICPQGKVLVNHGRFGGESGRFKYRASVKDCGGCPVQSRCTSARQRCLVAGRHHGALVRLRQLTQTDVFQVRYRRRLPVIEGLFAEGKQWHGLGRAWRRGLRKMKVQCLLIAAVLNFKRLAKLGQWRPAVLGAVQAVFLASPAVRRLHQTLVRLFRAILRPLTLRIGLRHVHSSLLGTTP